MDIKDLHSFICLYEEGNLRKAAGRLFITPQGLSRTLKAMENELSTQLFHRTAQGLQPTETGTIFYRQAKQMIQMYGNTLRTIDNAERNNTRLDFICAYGVMNALPFQRFLKFQEGHPKLDIHWREYPDLEAERLFEKEDYDFALLPFGNQSLGDEYEEIPLFQCRTAAVLPPVHPLTEKDCIEIEDLAGENLIIEGPDFRINRAFRELCSQRGITPHIGIETGDISFLHKLAAMGQGIGISVDFAAASIPSDSAAVIPITEDLIWPVSLILSKKKTLSSNGEEFCRFLIREFQKDPS